MADDAEYAWALGRHSALCAEIRGKEAGWHVIVVLGGQERRTAANLAGRRFGVYLPEILASGQPGGKEAMFPGYLFLFAWDIDWHWPRITGTPGVLGILAPIGEAEVDRVRAVENRYNPLWAPLEVVARPKRRWRRSRMPAMPEVVAEPEIVGVRSWSAYLDGADGEERNGLLRKALGL